jgi:hypothetical protein
VSDSEGDFQSLGLRPLWRKKRCLGTAQDNYAVDTAFVLIEGHPAFVLLDGAPGDRYLGQLWAGSSS